MLRYAGRKFNGGVEFYDLDEDKNPALMGDRMYPQWSSFQWKPMLIKYQGNHPYVHPKMLVSDISVRWRYVLQFNENQLKRDRATISELEDLLYSDPTNRAYKKRMEEAQRSKNILETEISDIHQKLSRLRVEPFISPRTGVTGFKVIF